MHKPSKFIHVMNNIRCTRYYGDNVPKMVLYQVCAMQRYRQYLPRWCLESPESEFFFFFFFLCHARFRCSLARAARSFGSFTSTTRHVGLLIGVRLGLVWRSERWGRQLASTRGRLVRERKRTDLVRAFSGTWILFYWQFRFSGHPNSCASLRLD